MADEEETRGNGRPFPWLAAALAVAIVLAVVFAVLWRTSSETTPEEVGDFLSAERDEAQDVAGQVVELLINYDSESLATRAGVIPRIATGSFREEYEALVGQELGAELEAAGASSEGEIIDGPDVTFASPTEAQAIVATRQTTQSKQNPEGVTFLYVMRVTLVESGDVWKADDVEILSRQTAG